MYHSITIGDKNTWDDWHLIPATRPLFNPPPVKTNYIEIPGGDGVLDLSTSLSGRPTYGNRTGSWDFYVENDFKDWNVLYSEIMAYLHGQTYTAILEDDPTFFYEGRFSVNQWKSDKNWSRIVIDYNVGPYKWDVNRRGEKWLWDPFNFETGVIQSYKNLAVSGTLSVDVPGETLEVVPIITSSVSGITVSYEGTTYTLKRGENEIDEIVIRQGTNTFVFTGNGRISIEVRGGQL